MFTKLVVPLDGSELAEHALPIALTLGEAAHGEVLLLRAPVLEQMLMPAAEGMGVIWPEQSYEQSLHETKDYLERVTASRAHTGLAVTGRVLPSEGDVASAIVEAAAAEGANLIVMSTHGYSGVTRWVLGSVTERVLQHAPCPVFVIRSPDPIRRVLIPLDGSALSESALEAGLALAALVGGAVLLLRVVPIVSAEDVARLNAHERGLGSRLQEDICEDATRYLHAVAAAHARPGLALETKVLIGPAAYAIVKHAEQEGFDAIVMATHGRTGLRRWAYGSVTEKVLRSASASTLVVRPAEHRLN